jgi:NAD(P)-dependent dehydrogenase (short-subunit alcohol dehydrogenase family)
VKSLVLLSGGAFLPGQQFLRQSSQSAREQCKTPSLDERIASQGDREPHVAFVARQPMARLGRPEEIAALVVYLASDKSAFTTGHIHMIDGGSTA